jgi:hypothetical protein
MTTIARLLLATALVFGCGCAKQDWIDRTLVTVDVTGTWSGRWEGGASGILLELEQQASTITGSIRFIGGGATIGGGTGPGHIEGTMAGDVFRFRSARGDVEGELTVINGDEMNGRCSISGGSRQVSLRRIEPSSPPASPPR